MSLEVNLSPITTSYTIKSLNFAIFMEEKWSILERVFTNIDSVNIKITSLFHALSLVHTWSKDCLRYETDC